MMIFDQQYQSVKFDLLLCWIWGICSEQNPYLHGFHILMENNLQELQKKGKWDPRVKEIRIYKSKQKCI